MHLVEHYAFGSTKVNDGQSTKILSVALHYFLAIIPSITIRC